jgi:Ner family transcriptional regulator
MNKVTDERLMGWHPAEISAAIKKKGSSLSKLSREHGFHPTLYVRACRFCMPTSHRAIAAFIGEPVQDIWPQFYWPNGTLRTMKERETYAVRAARGLSTSKKRAA